MSMNLALQGDVIDVEELFHEPCEDEPPVSAFPHMKNCSQGNRNSSPPSAYPSCDD
jgi:hypothetical protein